MKERNQALVANQHIAPGAPGANNDDANRPLRDCVRQALERYFEQLDGQAVTGVYDMVMAEVEVPLLLAVLKYSRHNQSRAAEVLGLNRGTLRKKLRQYDINPGDEAQQQRKTQ